MAKLRRSSSEKKKNGIVKLKLVAEKLHKSLSLVKKWNSGYVPEAVKEGHFAVVAEYGEEPRRFVVPLSYLTHPRFLVLLEQAAEEYGFDHDGALKIPCSPSELERILAEQWREGESNGDFSWNSCEPMIPSY